MRPALRLVLLKARAQPTPPPGGGGGGGGGPVQLDAATKPSAVTLSGSPLLVATRDGTDDASALVRATVGITIGSGSKARFEVQYTVAAGAEQVGQVPSTYAGTGDSGWGGYPTNATNKGWMQDIDGYAYAPNADGVGYHFTNGGPGSAGTWRGIEIDPVAKTMQIVLGTGTVSSTLDLSSLNGQVLYPAAGITKAGQVVTFNFGATSFVTTVASGYGAWPTS